MALLRRLRPFTGAAFGLLLAGCAGLSGPLEPPNVSLVDLRVLDVGLFEQRYGLTLRLQNPNPVEMPIAGMDYRVSLNDIDFGRGVSQQTATVPAYGESVVEVVVVSNLFNLVQRVQDLQQGRGQGLRIAIEGGVSLADRAGELPFRIQGDLTGRRGP
jgi:LEA14-like dessication related protein